MRDIVKATFKLLFLVSISLILCGPSYAVSLDNLVYDGSQESGYSNEIAIAATLSSPQNLRYSLNGTIVTINWDGVGGATGYKIGLGTESGNYVSVFTFGSITQVGPLDVSSYFPGPYYLAVKAYDGSQESGYSNEIAIAALSAPQNLRYSLSGTIVTINWDGVSGATGYKIGLGTASGNYGNVFTLGSITQVGPLDVSSYFPGPYYLAVKAFDGGRESGYSNEIAIAAPPKYTLSGDQEAIIAANGRPDYVIIIFTSDPESRQEKWTYKGLNKTFTFWDGVKLGETAANIDPSLYSKPPQLDTSLFTKDTLLSHLIYLFGGGYTEASVSTELFTAPADRKVYIFTNNGFAAEFLGGKLALIHSLDLP